MRLHVLQQIQGIEILEYKSESGGFVRKTSTGCDSLHCGRPEPESGRENGVEKERGTRGYDR